MAQISPVDPCTVARLERAESREHFDAGWSFDSALGARANPAYLPGILGLVQGVFVDALELPFRVGASTAAHHRAVEAKRACRQQDALALPKPRGG